MPKLSLKTIFLFLIGIWFIHNAVLAQNKSKLKISLTLQLKPEELKKTSITLLEDYNLIESQIPSSLGTIDFELDLNKFYLINFKNKNYFDQIYEVYTTVSDIKPDTTYTINLSVLFRERIIEIDTAIIFKKPIEKVIYDKTTDSFILNEKYSKWSKGQIVLLMNNYKKIKDQERLKALEIIAQENKKLEEARKKLEDKLNKEKEKEERKLKKEEERNESVENVDDLKNEIVNEINQTLDIDSLLNLSEVKKNNKSSSSDSTIDLHNNKTDNQVFNKAKEIIEEQAILARIREKNVINKQEEQLRNAKNAKDIMILENSKLKGKYLESVYSLANNTSETNKDKSLKEDFKVISKTSPIILYKKEEDFIKTLELTIVIANNKQFNFQKYNYRLGGEFYFLNTIEISKDEFNEKLAGFLNQKITQKLP